MGFYCDHTTIRPYSENLCITIGTNKKECYLIYDSDDFFWVSKAGMRKQLGLSAAFGASASTFASKCTRITSSYHIRVEALRLFLHPWSEETRCDMYPIHDAAMPDQTCHVFHCYTYKLPLDGRVSSLLEDVSVHQIIHKYRIGKHTQTSRFRWSDLVLRWSCGFVIKNKSTLAQPAFVWKSFSEEISWCLFEQ